MMYCTCKLERCNVRNDCESIYNVVFGGESGGDAWQKPPPPAIKGLLLLVVCFETLSFRTKPKFFFPLAVSFKDN